ncbi:hypothetical protein CYY_005386 [Polysphondylium violaceum]|uniref:ABC transporter domain-containing protein n=1 Tax=Polysphondylium violaceum TaxID=133409 RepID=A0A8J4PTU7_9MYCE|nr:hypothetical protein CYY_005386 [Polysphondylium violaceum]
MFNIDLSTFWHQNKVMIYKQWLNLKNSYVLCFTRFFIPTLFFLIFYIIVKGVGDPIRDSHKVEHPPLFFHPPHLKYVLGYKSNLQIPDFMVNVANDLDIDFNEEVTNNEKERNNTLCYVILNQLDNMVFNIETFIDITPPYSPIPQIFKSYTQDAGRYVVRIQNSIEKYIYQYYSGKNVNIQFSYQNPPKMIDHVGTSDDPDDMKNFHTWTQTFLYVGFTFQVIIFMYQIVSEKRKDMRNQLRILGLKDLVYYISWTLDGIIGSFIITIILLIVIYSNNEFYAFSRAPPSILFISFMCYGFSLSSFGMFISSFLSNPKATIGIGMLLVFFGGIFSFFMGYCGTYMFHLVDSIGFIIFIFPILNISYILNHISIFTLPTIYDGPDFPSWENGRGDGHSVLWQSEGRNYYWSNFLQDSPSMPMFSAFKTLNILFFSGFVYLFLAWYIENVIYLSTSRKTNLFFVFKKDYWLPQTGNLSPFIDETNDHIQEIPIGSDIIESQPTITEETIGNYSLIIRNLHFSYSNFTIKGFKKSKILQGLNLSLEKGNILCLQGPNGTGKSTTIKCITGGINSDKGNILLNGFNVEKQIHTIRTELGYLPQSDVLWENLTAKEHLNIYCWLRYNSFDTEKEIECILDQVRLSNVSNNRVSTFSGGMKRRLSIGLTLIGAPKIMVLDEPTSGIDISNKLMIYKLIKDLAKDRLIIFSTHIMDEAEALADKILILSNGSIKALGSPSYLKSQTHDSSYTLFIISNNNQETIDYIIQRFKSSSLFKQNLNYIYFKLQAFQDAMDFISEIESNNLPFILNWKVYESSLEEVYLKAFENDKKNQ